MHTTDLAYTKKDDIVSEFYHEWGSEIEELLGTWKNVNPKTGQISNIVMVAIEGKVMIRCFGKLAQGEQDWGQVACELFSSNVESPEIEGFACNFEFDFMEIRIAGNIKYGVMVIQSYNTFKDGSNRNNYFSREFFCK